MRQDVGEQFAQIAQELGFGLDAERLDVLTAVGEQLLADCDRLDELHSSSPPRPHPMRAAAGTGRRRRNPHHGWVWRCHIEGAADGPLRGRTVALKDTISLAGAPLLNGTELLEGFRPSRDATVVTRLLDAGATIAGKTAVPAFCCEGRA